MQTSGRVSRKTRILGETRPSALCAAQRNVNPTASVKLDVGPGEDRWAEQASLRCGVP